MKIESLVNLKRISYYQNIYQFFRSEKRFYLIPYMGRFIVVNTKEETFKYLDDKEVIPVSYSIRKEIINLPEGLYIGYLVNNTNNSFFTKSVYNDVYDYDLAQTLYLFDIVDKINNYDARLEKLKLYINTLKLSYILLPEIQQFFISNLDSNFSIWERLIETSTKLKDFFIRPFTHEIVLDDDILVSKDYYFKRGILVQKKEQEDTIKIVCKILGSYIPVTAGLDKKTFESLSLNDKILLSIRGSGDHIFDPIFVKKIF